MAFWQASHLRDDFQNFNECSKCRGTGRVRGSLLQGGFKECETCHGTGKAPRLFKSRCLECHGSGKVEGISTRIDCDDCDGRGYIVRQSMSYSPRVRLFSRCIACNGTGRTRNKRATENKSLTCLTCSGTGQIRPVGHLGLIGADNYEPRCCPTCRGTGLAPSEKFRPLIKDLAEGKCLVCNGTGFSKENEPKSRPRLEHITCTKCGGTGKRRTTISPDITCWRCNGTGFL